MSRPRLVPHPPVRVPQEEHLTLQATVTASFQLDVLPDLFDPGNDALARAWRQARRLLVVVDATVGDRADRLAAYLAAARRSGRLDDYRLLEGFDPRADGMNACDEVVAAAAGARLGRRDVFLSFGGARTGDVVALAASSYRRWTPALRIHRDLPSVLASIRHGVRVGLDNAPISALQRVSHVIVDEEGLLAEESGGPVDSIDTAEAAALLLLGLLEPSLLERLGHGSPAESRAEALTALLRLCRQVEPGNPAWRIGSAWGPLVPPQVPPAARGLWSLLLATRVAHRVEAIPAERLLAATSLVRRLQPDLMAELAAVPDEPALRRWSATRAGEGGPGAAPVLLPGAGGEPVAVEPARLRTALADLPELGDLPAAAATAGRAGPGLRVPFVSRMAIGARSDVRVPTSFPVRFAGPLMDDDNWDLADVLPPGGQVLAAVDAYQPGQLSRVHRLLARYRDHGWLSRFTVLPVDPTDPLKTLTQVARVMEAAEGLGLDAGDRIVVLGGGSVMDIVGYAAYLYHGDTPYVRVPTTLVGMIDAGIGLKVGVNVDGHKNLLGAYHPPLACVCDSTFLHTLAVEELRSGLAEAVKIAVVCDGALFDLIEARHADLLTGAATSEVRAMLHGSIASMLRQLEANPFEDELRRLPDFGHEFGHLLETMSQFRLRHGEAVAIGMALSSCLAVSTGHLRPDELDRLLNLLQDVGLPVWDRVCDPDVLWRKLHDDVVPHKGGQLHLVIPGTIGTGDFIDRIDELDAGMLQDACDHLRARAGLAERQEVTA
jgi:2-epi-5-epi-valiolone synthase